MFLDWCSMFSIYLKIKNCPLSMALQHQLSNAIDLKFDSITIWRVAFTKRLTLSVFVAKNLAYHPRTWTFHSFIYKYFREEKHHFILKFFFLEIFYIESPLLNHIYTAPCCIYMLGNEKHMCFENYEMAAGAGIQVFCVVHTNWNCCFFYYYLFILCSYFSFSIKLGCILNELFNFKNHFSKSKTNMREMQHDKFGFLYCEWFLEWWISVWVCVLLSTIKINWKFFYNLISRNGFYVWCFSIASWTYILCDLIPNIFIHICNSIYFRLTNWLEQYFNENSLKYFLVELFYRNLIW